MRRLIFASSFVLLVSAPLIACSGALDSSSGTAQRVTAAPSGSGTTTPAPSGTPSVDPLPEPAPEPMPMQPDAPLSVIEARCQDATHGPVAPYASFEELKGKLHGRWYACNRSSASGFYAREAGIELRSSGTWSFIRQNADGSFVNLQGIDHEGTWHEKYTDFTGYFQVNTATGMVLTEFSFEEAPRRMRTSGNDMPPVWFVPLGVD